MKISRIVAFIEVCLAGAFGLSFVAVWAGYFIVNDGDRLEVAVANFGRGILCILSGGFLAVIRQQRAILEVIGKPRSAPEELAAPACQVQPTAAGFQPPPLPRSAKR